MRLPTRSCWKSGGECWRFAPLWRDRSFCPFCWFRCRSIPLRKACSGRRRNPEFTSSRTDLLRTWSPHPASGSNRAICWCDAATPELDAEAAELEARLREYDYRHRLSVTQDRIEAEILADEILRIKAELERKHSEKADLLIRSPLRRRIPAAGSRRPAGPVRAAGDAPGLRHRFFPGGRHGWWCPSKAWTRFG